MRARYEVKRLSNAENIALSRQAADSAFPAVMAAVLYVLYKYRRWHKDRCVKLYKDVVALLNMPCVMGHYLTDEDIEKYLEQKLGIDFDEIRKAVHIA